MTASSRTCGAIPAQGREEHVGKRGNPGVSSDGTLDRRQLIGRLGGAVLGAALPAIWTRDLHAQPRRRKVAPNDRIGLGIIGAGDLGRHHHLPKFQQLGDFDVVAVADPDRRHLDDALQRTEGRAQGTDDFRRLLDRRDVDAVLIATPDHWHALAAVHACMAGKDVYCEKPLTLTIAEGRAIVEAARRYGRVFQVGTQQRSDARFRKACELVRNGKLGRIRHVRCVLGQGPTRAWTADAAPPPELDWNLWLGPAPRIAFNEARCHYNFRWFYDTSGGKLTDWGAHHLDIAQWGLGTERSGPVEVEATGVHPADNFYETAVEFDVRWTYAGGTVLQAVGDGENGVTFTGTDGEVFVSRSEIRATPPELLRIPDAELTTRLPRSDDHHENFLVCLRSRAEPVSDVESGHRSATVAHLGNIALRLGRKLQWDPAAERFTGDEAANRLVAKPMRSPWSL